jgi:hypothetical protein
MAVFFSFSFFSLCGYNILMHLMLPHDGNKPIFFFFLKNKEVKKVKEAMV